MCDSELLVNYHVYNARKVISFRDDKKIVASLDGLAEKQGIDRSDILRMMVREKLRVTTYAK
jgi:hypothetical protein